MLKSKIGIFLCMIVCFLFGISNVFATSGRLNCKNILSLNSTGQEVKILQQELNHVMNCNLDVDGIFGEETYQCTKKFQRQYGLTVDGIVSRNTCTKLNSYQVQVVTGKSVTSKKTTSSNSSKKTVSNYGVVIAQNLAVWKGANKDSGVKLVIKQGGIVQILGVKTIDGFTWRKIRYVSKSKTYYGYVDASYVRSTAILLDIAKQKLTYYKNGSILMEVPVITGTRDLHDTPTGLYTVQPDTNTTSTVLTGKNDDGSTYHAYVEYWMPFIPEVGIGFHDASWRSEDEYISETYQFNGSHGCVNMKQSDAKKLYENITGSVKVVVTNG